MLKYPCLSDPANPDDEKPRQGARASAPKHQLTFDDIIGESPKLRAVIELGKKLAEASFPSILIQGETGTGKELFARALHSCSISGNGNVEPFVEINSSAIPENLLEAELFGYERGAYTDAKNSKRGLLEVADGGTLFLDEIGNMSLKLQAKLLNVLEEKRFRRLGGTTEIAVNVKILTATNADLQGAIRDGYFREDLYYRLAIMSVELPPLRERGNDIVLLAENFLDQFCDQHSRPLKQLSERTKQLLLARKWPGNVRELRNAMQRAVLLSKDSTIRPQDVSLGVRSSVRLDGSEDGDTGNSTIALDVQGSSLDEMEKQIVAKALDLTNWNKTQAAAMLKISRPRLMRKIKALGVATDKQTPGEARRQGDA